MEGPSGGGKSTAWLTIAEWIVKTKSPAQMYVLDTDRAWEASQPVDGHLDSVINATTPIEWDDYKAFTTKLRSTDISNDDWLIVDMIDKPWTKAQYAYFEKTQGKELDEFFLEGHGAFDIGGDHGRNWQGINAMYNNIGELIRTRWPGHSIACTGVSEIRRDKSGSPTLKAQAELIVKYPEFGKIGFTPRGQKDLAHDFHSILFMQQAPSGWVWSTAKERNPPGMQEGQEGYRPYLAGERMNDFVRDYLFKIAKWRP